MSSSYDQVGAGAITTAAEGRHGRPANPKFDVFWDLIPIVLPGVLAGGGAGTWFAYVQSIRGNEETILLGVAGVAVGLLAVALAALALIVGLFEERFSDLFRTIGSTFKDFARPFKFVAVASGLGAVASIFGSMDSETTGVSQTGLGGLDLRAALFAVASGLVISAVFGAIGVVFTLIQDQNQASRIRYLKSIEESAIDQGDPFD